MRRACCPTDAFAWAETQRALSVLDRGFELSRRTPQGAADVPTAREARVERECTIDQRHHRADVLSEERERDPNYGGPALALAAVCRGRLYLHSRGEDPEEDRRKAAAYAHGALKVAGDDRRVLADSAYALMHP